MNLQGTDNLQHRYNDYTVVVVVIAFLILVLLSV